MSVMFAWLGDLCEDASDKLEDIEGLLTLIANKRHRV